MKSLIIGLLLSIVNVGLYAQQVPKTIIAEHYTNTYCSVCASRNPGFYTNLRNHSQVLHIAYHPSAPYPACPLNMHNISENNARTSHYGIYGSTPRLVVDGTVLSASANYSAPVIFSSVLGQTTSFTVRVQMEPLGTSDIVTTVTIKKVDTSSLSALSLYGALVEDTIFVPAANGEARSYDVFRKSLWGTTSLSVTAPAAVGDSVTYTVTSSLNTVWNSARMFAVAILQTADNRVVQSAKSANFVPTGVGMLNKNKTVTVYPSPAATQLSFKGDLVYPFACKVTSVAGKQVLSTIVADENTPINISSLPKGVYLITIQAEGGISSSSFVKE